MRFPSRKDCLAFLRAEGLKPPTVIDVGVLTGTPDLMAAFPSALHLLIEPEAAHRDAIAQAYAGLRHTLIEAAASDREGEAALTAEHRGGRSEVTHSHLLGDGRAGRAVRLARLDTLVAEAQAAGPFLLKIDTDGHEDAVLAGAPETLARSAVVIVEATPGTLAARLAACEAAGLRLFDIVDLAYLHGVLSQADLVFVNPMVFDPPALSPWSSKPFSWDAWTPHEPLADRLKARARVWAGRLLGRRR
jgi:FkbM family methyltransferase